MVAAFAAVAAVSVADVAAASVADVAAVAAASESTLICAEAAVGAVDACELAAMAAAAIASGAVALPDLGVAAADASVVPWVTGMTTATTAGVVADAPLCCGEAAGADEESDAEVLPEDDFLSDFAASAFEPSDLVRDFWTASLLAALLASETCLAAALSTALVAAGSELFAPGPVLSLFPAVLFGGGGEVDGCCCGCCCGCCWVVEAAPVSVGLLLSTIAPKLSVSCDGSARAGLAGAV